MHRDRSFLDPLGWKYASKKETSCCCLATTNVCHSLVCVALGVAAAAVAAAAANDCWAWIWIWCATNGLVCFYCTLRGVAIFSGVAKVCHGGDLKHSQSTVLDHSSAPGLIWFGSY